MLLFIPSFCPSVTSMLTVKTARLNVSLNCLHHPDLVALAVNSFFATHILRDFDGELSAGAVSNRACERLEF